MANETYENVQMPEEWEIPQEYRYEPLENVQGLYNLKSSSLTKPKERGIFNAGGRKSYDYIPQYLIAAAEEKIKEHYEPKEEVKAIEDSGLKPSLKKRFEEEIIPITQEEGETKEGYAKMIAKRHAEQKAKYDNAVSQVIAEEAPKIETPTERIAQIEKEIVTEAITPPTNPIAELTETDRIKNEIKALKEQKARLEELRSLKLEKLKLQLGNIPRGFKEKHPILSSIAAKATQAGKSIGKRAIAAATPTEEDRIARQIQLVQIAKNKKQTREQRLATLRAEFERLTLNNKISHARKGEILPNYRGSYYRQPKRKLVKDYLKTDGTYVPAHYRKLNIEAVA